MFNAINIETIQGILLAAEENGSPVILSLPEVDWWYVETDLVIRCMAEKAGASSVPVVLHYDHGHNIETMKKLLDAGWSSLMIDASTRPLEENIEITAGIVEMAKKYGASVEGELGHVLGIEGIIYADDQMHIQDLFTKVDEAVYFVEKTGVNALAVAIGTVHGEYRGDRTTVPFESCGENPLYGSDSGCNQQHEGKCREIHENVRKCR